MRSHKLWLVAIAVWLTISCNTEKKTIHRSFYYWKSIFSISESERSLLRNIHIEKLYVKFFDVTWEEKAGMAIPVAILQFEDNVPKAIEIIPVIYLTNASLKNTNDSLISSLSKRIHKLLYKLATANHVVFQEVQFDCDWTESTEEKFFSLIRNFRSLDTSHVILSSTIRLHQIKYADKTGIPPVDKGMLMFYNMGKLNDVNTKNSIFDTQTASAYINSIKNYPLPLDAALPAFTWAVHIRGDRTVDLINNISARSLDTLRSLRKIKSNLYAVDSSSLYNGTYLTKNDMIRLEEISPSISLEAAKLLAPELKNHNFTVALYHFDRSNIVRYEEQDFENTFSAFH